MNMDIFEWLTNWYSSNCNDEWEHTYGIKIDTLDNPGWSFKADLVGTEEEGKRVSMKIMNNDNDWFEINSDGEIFTAYGDASKLQFLMNKFKEFVETIDSQA